MERYMGRLNATMDAMQEEYDAMMTALEKYFMTDDVRKAVFDGEKELTDDQALDLAIRLGVDPDFAFWLFA
jgi:hypothetical protein